SGSASSAVTTAFGAVVAARPREVALHGGEHGVCQSVGGPGRAGVGRENSSQRVSQGRSHAVSKGMTIQVSAATLQTAVTETAARSGSWGAGAWGGGGTRH